MFHKETFKKNGHYHQYSSQEFFDFKAYQKMYHSLWITPMLGIGKTALHWLKLFLQS